MITKSIFRPLICLLLGILGTQVGQAEQFVLDLSLDLHISNDQPIVKSLARAVLYTDMGTRNYSEVILGHQVNDDTGWTVGIARIVSSIGYANNLFDDIHGDWEYCYQARMAAHANYYGLHEDKYSSPKCFPPQPPAVIIPKENCPILLDLERDGYHLSGVQPPVRFDIDADGIRDEIAWTEDGEDEAFLCLDRNRNGLIDDGGELFGYATPLLSGKPAKVGYRALEEFDTAEGGGDNNGWIDEQDRIFADLCVWNDSNRDGTSQARELFSLEDVGVVALEYSYRNLHLEDPFGNLFRYASVVRMRTDSAETANWQTYDVIFAEPK